MSSKEVELCHFLTEEFFGPIVADVVTFMCNHGYQTLRIIAMQTKLKNDQVRPLALAYDNYRPSL